MLAHYEVVEPIGQGGMGEVYRAKDTKLGRDVAIKVLPDELAADEERLRRFQREARVLASLNHPNIAAIYGLEHSDDTNYLVLELVPGETLAGRIERGSIPVDEALAIARKVADALEEAHEQGIVHRDLKPANVKLTPDDKVKVLDFGLAKAFVEDESEGDAATSMSPTITRDATRVGVILGTAAYMSPEQAKGKRVDKRTDVFAFGALLYEMLTGRKAFPGDDVSEILAAVLKLDPEWKALEVFPPRLVELVRGCLEKDPRRRRRDIGDVRNELDKVLEVDAAPVIAAPARRKRWIVPRRHCGRHARRCGAEPAPRAGEAGRALRDSARRRALLIGRLTRGRTVAGRLTYRSRRGRANQRAGTDSLESVAVRGSEGSFGSAGRMPQFSPDGEWLAFWASGQLSKVAVSAGAPLALASIPSPWGISWDADGSILYGAREGIWRVSADGGEPELLVERGDTHRIASGPQMLPGGDAVLFTLLGDEGADIVVQPMPEGERRVLTRGTDARYMDSGHLLFTLENETTLLALAFDPDSLETRGGPVVVLDGVGKSAYRAAQYHVSSSGSLIYIPVSSGDGEHLVWADLAGETPLSDRSGVYQFPRISPDGRRVAVCVMEATRQAIWLWDLERETSQPLTTTGEATRPMWSGDGQWVAFYWRPEDSELEPGVYRRRSDFSGEAQLLLPSEEPILLDDWSRDGRWLVFSRNTRGSLGLDLWAAALDGSEPRALVSTGFTEGTASLSPDGRHIAYSSDASGRLEAYVTAFPEPGRTVQLSTGGGMDVAWMPSGDGLTFVHPVTSLLFRVDVTMPGLEASPPRPWLTEPVVNNTLGREYDVHPDGERVILAGRSAALPPKMVVVLNWVEELKRLVPAE